MGDPPERRLPLQDVAHQRAALTCVKLMNVAQPLERAADLLVDKEARPIELHDFRSELLAQCEMPALERDEISQLKQAGKSSGLDDSLAGERSASRMHIDVESKIETDRRWRGDERLDRDTGQARPSALFLIARSHITRMIALPGRITRQ